MPRRSKIVQIAVDEIKSQPRRPRKKREVREIPYGFKAGQLVIVKVPNTFKGTQFGIVFEACKYNDGGISVRLSDDGSIARYVCVRPELGDTIERLNSNNGDQAKPV